MLSVERKNIIYKRLCENGKVLVNELAEEFGVSDETIRRDLEKLEQEGLAEKIYGGAVKAENTFYDLPFHIRQNSNVAAKQAIADAVLPHIQNGGYIALDASTTALEIMRRARNVQNLTLITNAVEVLFEFSQKNDWNIISTGGTLKSGSLSLVGGIAEKTVSGFNVDICICSCKGLSVEKGCTDSSESEAAMKRAMLASAKQKILAVDSTKLDKVSFAKVCDIKDFDMIVTDKKPPVEFIETAEKCGIKLIY